MMKTLVKGDMDWSLITPIPPVTRHNKYAVVNVSYGNTKGQLIGEDMNIIGFGDLFENYEEALALQRYLAAANPEDKFTVAIVPV